MRTYQQLTYKQQCQISALKKSGCSQRMIAETIGTTQPTVSRELARNTGGRGYRHKQAQERTEQRRAEASQLTKMTPDMITVIESKLRVEWSPEHISGWLLLNDPKLLISHESIYLHVWKDKHAGGDLYAHLRQQGKKYNKRRNGKSTRGQIRNRVSIDDRPTIVDDTSRIGDWEIDTVIGKGHSGALVTIVERVTKLTVSTRVNSKSAAEVTQTTIALLKPFEDVVYTITADNGKEFAYHEQISKALSAEVYFAHPYSSWERGLNENTNGLLRQYFPKNTDFKKVEQIEVRRALARLNSRPRKDLDFKTPAQLMDDHRAALAA
ncbi:MAG: IS30 family transposase [Candidatus Endonucleobacter bathymodioli]|uniref:IS30 family transposase n=1 Tax=Candidatus Endonucleibacter bathymodioli TaxID=539814 RepID=A0AA90NQG1_9GAMM|nr:IS30 family transposase [Candidatus Endonucleobacter bathymodioli]